MKKNWVEKWSVTRTEYWMKRYGSQEKTVINDVRKDLESFQKSLLRRVRKLDRYYLNEDEGCQATMKLCKCGAYININDLENLIKGK